MTKATRFTQADLTRAVQAMRKAGLCVKEAEIKPDGTIRLLTGEREVANDAHNPLRRMLNG